MMGQISWNQLKIRLVRAAMIMMIASMAMCAGIVWVVMSVIMVLVFLAWVVVRAILYLVGSILRSH